MERRTTDRITLYIALSGLVLSLACFVLGGFSMGIGAFVGGAVSVANWLALRWLVARVLKSGARRAAAISILLVAKMGLLFGIVYVLVSLLGLDPIGVVIGLGSLLVGVLVAAAMHGAPADEASSSTSSSDSPDRPTNGAGVVDPSAGEES